jgi:hypothetical protein
MAKVLAPAALAVSVLISSAATVMASGEASYLTRFDGRWSGAGTLTSGLLGGVALRCDVSGQADGERLRISGRCSGSGFSTNVAATLRYDPRANRYVGTWSDGATGTAGLAGSRRGATLSLAVTGEETRRMTLTAQGGNFRLSLDKQDGAKVVSIAFQRS